jgi:predicted phosphodiesterase
VNTLVISDLHLAAGGGRALLHSPEVRRALIAKLRGVDRLVLLGDVVELREQPVWQAMADAAPVILALAKGLDPHAEVIILPGNHDHQFVAQWSVRRAHDGTPPPLGLESSVSWCGGDPVEQLADLWGSGGATVRVHYPGVWLREDIYATHGHYLDRHGTLPAFERLAAGAMGKYLKLSLKDTSTAEDYEAVLAPIYAWMFQISQYGGKAEPDAQEPGSSHNNASARIWKLLNDGDGLTKLALSSGITAATSLLSVAGLGPLKSDISGDELYRSGVRGFAAVLEAMDVDAEYALYGHTHRAGPLPSDDADLWVTKRGTKMINTGCWVSEEAIVGSDLAETAYRPGFAVRIDSDTGRPPELVNLLERGSLTSA